MSSVTDATAPPPTGAAHRSRSDPRPAPDRVVVLNDDAVAQGGAAHLALRQIALLRERHVPVTFVAGDAAPPASLRGLDVEYVGLGAARLRDSPAARAAVQGIWHRRAGLRIARWIAEHDTPRTAYHVHAWSNILSPAAFAALGPVAGRTWLHAHDYFPCCPNGAFYLYPERRRCALVPLSLACARTRCDKVSRAQKAWRMARQATLRATLDPIERFAGVWLLHGRMREPFERSGYPAASLRVLGNPVPAPPAERVVAEANERLVYVGRLETEKGVEALLRAARELGLEIDVAGEGALGAALRAAHPEARFHGWLDAQALAALVAEARFVLAPTLVPEPFGLVLAEALRAGVPVLVTREAALADEIVAAGAGLACDPADPVRLRAQLAAVAAMDAGEVSRMSRAARDWGERACTSETAWVEALLEGYRGTWADR